MQDDSDLVEAALNVLAKRGRLILRRRIWINGIAYDPATYLLQHVGVAPECDHEWVDARNSAVESGELCIKCSAVRAGNATTDLPK